MNASEYCRSRATAARAIELEAEMLRRCDCSRCVTVDVVAPTRTTDRQIPTTAGDINTLGLVELLLKDRWRLVSAASRTRHARRYCCRGCWRSRWPGSCCSA